MQDGGGGKRGDAGKVRVLQIPCGIQAAAAEDGILDAGRQKIPEACFQIRLVQTLQKTVLRIIGEVAQMFPINLVDGAERLLHKQPAHVRILRRAVPLCQRLFDGGAVFLPELPQVGPLPVRKCAGVGL